MPQVMGQPDPYQQFCKAESQVMGLLGMCDGAEDKEHRLFSINAWDSVDKDLLAMFPAISTALAVLQDEEQQQQQQSSIKHRHSSLSSSSSKSSSSSSCSGGGSNSSSCSASPTMLMHSTNPAAAAAALASPHLPLKDLQLLISKEDLASLPQATSMEEVMALLSKDDVIMVPTQGGTILYEITYLDDLAGSAQQAPTVIPPTPDDPANQLSPEVFNFFLQTGAPLMQQTQQQQQQQTRFFC